MSRLQEKMVSIIVPAYNAEKYIMQCIDSILNQSYHNIEIIVVLDESTDKTRDVIMHYNDRVRIINQQKKTSPSIARNRGISEAKGDYIAFCDSDDIFDVDKIELQVGFLEENPSVGLTYTDFILIDSTGNRTRQVVSPEWNFNLWIFRQFVAFSSVLMRRELISKLMVTDGYYFDESYPAFEDFDFLLRITRESKFSRVPGFLVCYRNSPKSLGKRYQWMVPLRLKILKKNGHYLALIYFAFVDTPLAFLRIAFSELNK